MAVWRGGQNLNKGSKQKYGENSFYNLDNIFYFEAYRCDMLELVLYFFTTYHFSADVDYCFFMSVSSTHGYSLILNNGRIYALADMVRHFL
jgi:hypothetical protein